MSDTAQSWLNTQCTLIPGVQSGVVLTTRASEAEPDVGAAVSATWPERAGPAPDFLVDTVITNKLEAVDGVGRLEVEGLLDDSVRILLDEDRVFAANLDIGGLIGRLSSDNFSLPMGEVTDGGSRILLRSDMRFSSPDEIENFPIGNGLTLAEPR